MHHVLLVEDSEECQLVVRRALSSDALKVTCCSRLADAKRILSRSDQNKIDLILLDLAMPDGDGLGLLDEIQSQGTLQDTPVFLLTSSEDLTLKVTAFAMGAEDYLVKPFNPIELRARVEMRLKKSTSKKRRELLRKGDLLLRPSLMQTSVLRDGTEKPLDLTSKEFKILAFLATNEGRVYSRSELVKCVWGPTVHVLDRTVDSHICGLRKKLDDLAHYVECIPNAGYRFLVKQSN